MHFKTPDGWLQVTLGDLLLLIRNGTTATQVDDKNPYPVTRIETISEGVIDRSRIKYLTKPEPDYLLRSSDVLYSHINSVAHIGKVALYNDSMPLYHGMNLMLLRPRLDVVDPRFLFAVLSSEPARAHARREAKKAINQASLGQGEIKALVIQRPSLPEQRRIAEILDTIDTAIQQSEALVAKLKVMKAGLLHDLLSRGLDEQGQLRNPIAHPEQFKDSPLGRIPREWSIGQLSSVAEIERGKFTHRPRNDPFFYGGPYPFIQTSDVASAEGGALMTYTQTLNNRGVAVSRLFPSDTIAANIGDTAILGIPMYFPDSVVGVVVREPNNVRYVELCIRRAKHGLNARAPQSAQKNINLEDLRPLLLSIPNPGEQDLIASAYSAHDSRIRAEEVYLEKLKLQKKGLMHDLLTGKVRTVELATKDEK